MAVTPGELFSLAEALAQADAEPWWRAAIGRAYYAAFHEADRVSQLDAVSKYLMDTDDVKIGAHEQVIKRFAFDGAEPRMRALGYALRVLKQDREAADYNLVEEVTKTQAEAHLIQTRRLMERLALLERAPDTALK